jgi:hypothetical protein
MKRHWTERLGLWAGHRLHTGDPFVWALYWVMYAVIELRIRWLRFQIRIRDAEDRLTPPDGD